MNITNAATLNKELASIKRPSSIENTAFRLMYIYPMIFDESIGGIQFNTFARDSDNIVDLTRSFFSITILKEIFVSNTINLISLASKINRDPIEDPKVRQLIGSLLRNEVNYNQYEYSQPQRESIPKVDPYVLQRKIQQKIVEMKSILKMDPRYKKLLPFIQVITLQNMLDVPVIVGTQQIPIDSASIYSLLVAALAERKTIDNYENVKILVRKLMTLNEDKLYDMFKIAEIKGSTSVPSIVPASAVPGGIPSQLEKLQSRYKSSEDENEKKSIEMEIDKIAKNYAFDNIRAFKEQKIQNLERVFKFILDEEQLKLRYGLGNEESQASGVVRRVDPQIELLFSKTQQNLYDFLSGISPSLLFSIDTLLAPRDTTNKEWNKTFGDIRNMFIEKIASEYQSIFDDSYKKIFKTIIAKSIDEAKAGVASFKTFCDGTGENFKSYVREFNFIVNQSSIDRSLINVRDVSKFSDNIDYLSSKSEAISKKIEVSMQKFLGNQDGTSFCRSLNTIVSSAVSSFLNEYTSIGQKPGTELSSRIYLLTNISDEVEKSIFDESKYIMFVKSLQRELTSILYTVLLLIFQLNMCDFIEIVEMELDVSGSNVTELPNFCLVIPLEILQALYVFYTKRNWAQALQSANPVVNPLNSSNYKGMTKAIATQLGIPNLFVFDRKKGEMYYYLKHSKLAAEKVKLQAMNLYVEQNLKTPEIEQGY